MIKKKALIKDVAVMESLDNLTSQAFERYFNVLEKTGYVKDKDVYKLLLLDFLQDIIDKYPYFITDKDYALINNILVCLYSTSCLVPFAQYLKMSESLDNYIISIPIRITENNIIRHTQMDELRLVNLLQGLVNL